MYRTKTGRTLVLAHYSPAEWGAEMKARLIDLGCSEEYATAVEKDYAGAKAA